MKIKVCIPFYNEFDTCKPGLRELVACKEHQFDIFPTCGVYIATARNHAVSKNKQEYQKIDSPYDYYLFIDSDITFHLRDVLRLIEANTDAISAPYLIHGSKFVYQCGYFKTPGSIKEKCNIQNKGVMEIDWCGGGFLLVKKEVFEKCSYPWFKHPLVQEDALRGEAGEDIGFSMNLKEHGITLFCDFDIKIGHVPMRVDKANFDLNMIKPKAEDLIHNYYTNSNKYLLEAEKEKAKIIAIAESLGWTGNKLNEFLGVEFIKKG